MEGDLGSGVQRFMVGNRNEELLSSSGISEGIQAGVCMENHRSVKKRHDMTRSYALFNRQMCDHPYLIGRSDVALVGTE